MNRRPFWFTQAAVLALALSVVTACSDDDGAGPEAVDPVETAAVVDATVDQFFDQNEAIQGLEVFGDAMAAALGGAAPSVAIWDMVPSSSYFESAKRVRASVSDLGDGRQLDIPSGALGVTFIYDPVEGYIPSQRTGAPANGVRFILYAVDPILGQPITPLQEIGYFDIMDDSDFATGTIDISLEAVVDGVSLVNVSSVGTITETSLNLDFDGTISDGTNSITFTIDALVTETDFDLTFGLSAGTFTITTVFSATDTGGGSVTTTFSDGDNTIVLSLSVDASDNIGSGSGVSFNGTTVAVISGTIDNPTITNAEGDPLTAEELAALEDLFVAMVDVIDFFFGVFEFAFLLLFLAG